jgi:hypothetical protein
MPRCYSENHNFYKRGRYGYVSIVVSRIHVVHLSFCELHYLGINVAVHGICEVLRGGILEVLCPNSDLN